MCLCEIFIFACEECDLIPKVSVQMTLYSVSYGFGLPDINSILSCLGINASKKVDTRFV